MLETGGEARMGSWGKSRHKTEPAVSLHEAPAGFKSLGDGRSASYPNNEDSVFCQHIVVPVSCRERSNREKKSHHATANLAQWWLEGHWAMVLSEGLVLKWDYKLIWKKEEGGGAQASKRAEIFKCRQTHSSKRDHFIIINGGAGEETLKWDGNGMVRCDFCSWMKILKIERFTRVCVSVCICITGCGIRWSLNQIICLFFWGFFFFLSVRSFLWPLPLSPSLSLLSEPE